MGREGREEFWERKAPIKADAMTMGNTFYFETEDCGKEVKYIPPAFAREVSRAEFLKNINKPGNHRALSVKGAHWSFEYGGQEDCVKDSEDVDKELLQTGIWNLGLYQKQRKVSGGEKLCVKKSLYQIRHAGIQAVYRRLYSDGKMILKKRGTSRTASAWEAGHGCTYAVWHL